MASRDVLQQRFFLSLFGPSHFYVRYRCSRCQRIGERYIPENMWNPALFREGASLPNEQELKRYRKLGRITLDEQIDFHFALARLSAEPEGE